MARICVLLMTLAAATDTPDWIQADPTPEPTPAPGGSTPATTSTTTTTAAPAPSPAPAPATPTPTPAPATPTSTSTTTTTTAAPTPAPVPTNVPTPLPTPVPTTAHPTPKPTPLPTREPTPLPTPSPTPPPVTIPYKTTVKAAVEFAVPGVEAAKYEKEGVQTAMAHALAVMMDLTEAVEVGAVDGLTKSEPKPKITAVCAKTAMIGYRCPWKRLGKTPKPTPTPTPKPTSAAAADATTSRRLGRFLQDVSTDDTTLHFDYVVEGLDAALKQKVVTAVANMESGAGAKTAFVAAFVTSAAFAAEALTPMPPEAISSPAESLAVVKVPEFHAPHGTPDRYSSSGAVYKKLPMSTGKTCANNDAIYLTETVKDAAMHTPELPQMCADDCTNYVGPDPELKCIGFEIRYAGDSEAHCLLHKGVCEGITVDNANSRGLYGLGRDQPLLSNVQMLAALGLVLLGVVFVVTTCRGKEKPKGPAKRGITKKEKPTEEELEPLQRSVPVLMPPLMPNSFGGAPASFNVRPGLQPVQPYGYQPMQQPGSLNSGLGSANSLRLGF